MTGATARAAIARIEIQLDREPVRLSIAPVLINVRRAERWDSLVGASKLSASATMQFL
jgi:hypothetical protein